MSGSFGRGDSGRARGYPSAMLLSILLCALGCSAEIGPPLVSFDAQPPDAEAVIDAYVSPPDASPPDALVLPACDDTYGQALEYLLCIEDDTTCEFNARTGGGTCDEMCAQFGGVCLGAYDNVSDPGAECDRIVASGDDCFTPRNTEICVCSR